MQEGESNETRICYNVEVSDSRSDYGLIVVSSNGATAVTDVEVLSDVQDVQSRSVTFFVATPVISSCNRKLVITPK